MSIHERTPCKTNELLMKYVKLNTNSRNHYSIELDRLNNIVVVDKHAKKYTEPATL